MHEFVRVSRCTRVTGSLCLCNTDDATTVRAWRTRSSCKHSFAAGAGPTSGVAAEFAAHLATVQLLSSSARAPALRRVGLPLRKGEVELPQHGVDVLDGRVEVRSQRAARQHHLDVRGRWFGCMVTRAGWVPWFGYRYGPSDGEGGHMPMPDSCAPCPIQRSAG